MTHQQKTELSELKKLPEGNYRLTSVHDPAYVWDVALEWSPGWKCMWVRELPDGNFINPLNNVHWLNYIWERIP